MFQGMVGVEEGIKHIQVITGIQDLKEERLS